MPIYRLHIVLEGITPYIWRDLEVDASTRLPLLGRVLLTAMGWKWEDEDPYLFTAGTSRYGKSDCEDNALDETAYTLADIAHNPGSCFHLDYQWEWRHFVTLQAIVPAEEDTMHPRCLDGANACPHVKCDGISDYADLLGVLADTGKHKERARLQELWVGESFDPQCFDLEEINTELLLLTLPFQNSQHSRWR